MIILLLISFYCFGVYGAYKFVQKVYYHPDGRWNLIKPDRSDIIAIFTPFLNWGLCYDLLMGNWKREDKRRVSFFEPRKSFKTK